MVNHRHLNCVCNSVFWLITMKRSMLYISASHSVPNHQPHVCLLNRLIRRRPKKTSKRHWPLCGEFTGDRNQIQDTVQNVNIPLITHKATQHVKSWLLSWQRVLFVYLPAKYPSIINPKRLAPRKRDFTSMFDIVRLHTTLRFQSIPTQPLNELRQMTWQYLKSAGLWLSINIHLWHILRIAAPLS